MNIEKNPIPIRNKVKLVLSLEENGFYKEYYQVSSSTGSHLFLLSEFTRSLRPDYCAIYFNWKYLIRNLNSCESKAWRPIKNKWWSYCPQWLYFNPVFIENDFRPLFNNELYKNLDGIFEEDLSEADKFRFKIWMKACEPETYQLNLFA